MHGPQYFIVPALALAFAAVADLVPTFVLCWSASALAPTVGARASVLLAAPGTECPLAARLAGRFGFDVGLQELRVAVRPRALRGLRRRHERPTPQHTGNMIHIGISK